MERNTSSQSFDFKNFIPVSWIAEFLSKPITIIDHNGKHRSFRKFLSMGNWGFTDIEGMDVIVPANPGYQQLDIFVHTQVLVAGYYSTGWDIFSLDGEKIKTYPPMSIDKLEKLVDEWKNQN